MYNIKYMEQQNFSLNQLIIGGVAVAIVASIIGYYYWNTRVSPEAPGTIDVAAMQTAVEEENEVITDIGASTETATLKDAIPTVTPTTNPLKNIYKNPFE